MTNEIALKPCRFCGNPPGTKVGPPALARCITPGCKGNSLGAETFEQWNTRALPAQGEPAAIFEECAEIALEHVGQGPAGTDLEDRCRRIGYDDACREIAEAIRLRASNRKKMDAIADARAGGDEKAQLVNALSAIEQRANESGTGEMDSLETVHALARIARVALALVKP